MSQQSDLNWFYAQLATMGVTERYQVATMAELYYIGRQYDGLPNPDDQTVPFRHRRPRVIIPLFKEAVDEIVRFTWGGHRFPSVTVDPTRAEDDAPTNVGPQLDKAQAEKITRFVRALVRAAQLPSATKEASRKAGVGRSAALILGFKGGYPTVQTEAGKHCTPVPHPKKPRRLESLEVKYQYPKEVEIAPNCYQTKPYWYRRVITSTRDVTFKDVPVIPGVQPTWTEDPDHTIEFGYDLGEAPVVWFRTLPDDCDQIDGQPLVDPQLYALIDDVNFTVSQRSRGLKHVIDPQPVLTGVEEGEENAFVKNPGAPWFLPDPAAKAQFLEMNGEGLKRACEHVDDLTQAFQSACHYVKANPEATSGNISGVVLEFLHAPMIALASDLRVDFGDNGYVAAITLFLQMCTLATEAGKDVWVQGVEEAATIMRAAQMRGVWLDPPVTIAWQPFFPETEQDKQARVAYTTAAEQASLISPATATKHVATIFQIEDTATERDAIDEERDAAMKREGASLLLPPRGTPQQQPAPGAPATAGKKSASAPDEE